MSLIVPVKQLPHGQGLDLPQHQTSGAAGLDLLAAIAEAHPVVIAPGGRVLVPTGLVMQIPAGFEGQVRPRSGLALKHGITVLNAPGTIDSDYRGEVSVLLINHGDVAVAITRGMRIAQIVFAPVAVAQLQGVELVDATLRGSGGYGSTGAGRIGENT